MRIIDRVADRVRHVARATVNYVQSLWSRLTTEPGYAEAAAAVAVSTVSLLSRNPRLVRLTHETANAIAALIRTLIRERSREGLGPRDAALSWSVETGWDGEAAWV